VLPTTAPRPAVATPASAPALSLGRPARRGLLQAPLLVLAGGLLLTTAATAFVAVSVAARDQARFETLVQSTSDRITSRLDTYSAMLDGAAGLFAASSQVGRDEFRRYVHHLDLRERYPGIQGVGFSQRVAPEELARFEAVQRASGVPGFRVSPPGTRDEYHAIVYLEPADRRNQAAMGYDMFSEPQRRAAMMAARDQGVPRASGRVTLRQEIDAEKQGDFLIYVPVYVDGLPPLTIEDRRERLLGFVYAPFRLGDLFTGLFRNEIDPRVRFRVFEGPDTLPAQILHDSHPRSGRPRTMGLRGRESVDVAGARWTVMFTPLPSFWSWSGHGYIPLIALVGCALSTVMYLLTRAQAVARAAAEESEAARGRFYAAMSHELRTPLTAIIGYNHLLLDGAYGPVPDEQRRSLARSQQAASHLLELVNDVLDLSKLQAGRLSITPGQVEVPALVEDTIATMRHTAESRGCAIAFVDTGCPSVLQTDARRVRQILLNLLSNATKFGAGQPIEVRCAAGPDGTAVVEVVDHGPGIAPEHQPRLFEEFVQLPGIPSDAPGTGLGLAISRALAHLLGGTLTVESMPGVGSTFRLTLPEVGHGTREVGSGK
jgi:signal transduction histidine kinase